MNNNDCALLQYLEEVLFSLEFDENPFLSPFSIKIGNDTYQYEVVEYDGKYYISTSEQGCFTIRQWERSSMELK